MLQNGEFDTIYHEHHSFFCMKSFSKLANRCALNIIDAQHANIHGGSMVWYLSKTSTVQTKNYLNMYEAESQFVNDDGFKKFSANAILFKDDLTNKCNEYKREGYKVVGYGAAAKGNTVLNYCQVVLDYIIDDNILKQFKFTPGLDIEVFPVDKLKETDEPLLIIITAWNFAAEIKGRILKVRNNPQDKFLTYFPTFKFIE